MQGAAVYQPIAEIGEEGIVLMPSVVGKDHIIAEGIQTPFGENERYNRKGEAAHRKGNEERKQQRKIVVSLSQGRTGDQFHFASSVFGSLPINIIR